MPEVEVSKLAIGPSGRLWIATEGQGVFSWNGSRLEAVTGFESRFVSDLAFYQGKLYLSTDQGVYALSSWPFRSERVDLLPDFPALMAPSDSSLFFLSASGQLLDLEGHEHSAVFPTNETVLDLFHAAGRGLIAETEEDQWNFRSGRWQKLDSERTVEGRRSKVFQYADVLRSFASDRIPRAQSLHHIWSVSSSGLWHAYREAAGQGYLCFFPGRRVAHPMKQEPSLTVRLDRWLLVDRYREWALPCRGPWRGAFGIACARSLVFACVPFRNCGGTGEALLSREGGGLEALGILRLSICSLCQKAFGASTGSILFQIRLDGAIKAGSVALAGC